MSYYHQQHHQYAQPGYSRGPDPYAAAYDRRSQQAAHHNYAAYHQHSQMSMGRSSYAPGYGMPSPAYGQQQYGRVGMPAAPSSYAPYGGGGYGMGYAVPPAAPPPPDRTNMLDLEGAKGMMGRNERIIIKLVMLQQALEKSGPVPKPQLVERMNKLRTKLHKRLSKMATWLDLPNSDRAKRWLGVPPLHRVLVLENKLIKEPKQRRESSAAGGSMSSQQRRPASYSYQPSVPQGSLHRSSRYPGAVRDPNNPGYWNAFITLSNGTQQPLGLFASDEDAGHAYNIAMNELRSTGQINHLLHRFPNQLDGHPQPAQSAGMHHGGGETAAATSGRGRGGRKKKATVSKLKKKKRGEDDDSDYEGEEEDSDSEDSDREDNVPKRGGRSSGGGGGGAAAYDASMYGRGGGGRGGYSQMDYYGQHQQQQHHHAHQQQQQQLYRNMPGAGGDPHHHYQQQQQQASYAHSSGGYYNAPGAPASYSAPSSLSASSYAVASASQYGQPSTSSHNPSQPPPPQGRPPASGSASMRSMDFLTTLATQQQQALQQQHHHHPGAYSQMPGVGGGHSAESMMLKLKQGDGDDGMMEGMGGRPRSKKEEDPDYVDN